jgi:hypothetical protein
MRAGCEKLELAARESVLPCDADTIDQWVLKTED